MTSAWRRDGAPPVRGGTARAWHAGRQRTASRSSARIATLLTVGGVRRKRRATSANVDPPRRRRAEVGRHLLTEARGVVLHLGGVLRELLALGLERLLLLGADVDGERADAAGRGAALRVLAAGAGERRELRIDVADLPLGGAEVALERVPPERRARRVHVRVRVGAGGRVTVHRG